MKTDKKVINKAVNSLKTYIEDKYDTTKVTIRDNMVRGHLRSLSTDIEDGVAAFLLDILPDNYTAYVDATVQVRKKHRKHRPDILIIDDKKNVKALVEVKTNMGWCRDASGEIEKILYKHNEMISKGNIICEFSNDSSVEVYYSENVPVYLVAFTKQNCGDEKHENNRKIAESKGIHYHLLFSGWYDGTLIPLEINKFAEEIIG